jgi:hypothetical protein
VTAGPRLRRPTRPAVEPAPAPTLADRVRDLAGIIAPTTVITAMMVYFGLVATRARFAYFGVYLELTDLSNQDLVLYGLETLYVPVALALVAVLLAVLGHAGVTWLATAPGRRGQVLLLAAALAGVGALLIARALVGILAPEVARQEVPGTTPLALAAGPLLLTYAGWVAAGAATRDRRFATWYAGPGAVRARRAAVLTTGGLVLAGLFWAVNSFAWAFGEGRAYDDAVRLPRRPEVVLDTREPLTDLPEGVSEQALAPDPQATYRYRYRGFRLLVEGGGRLFLVPARWTAESRTIVVPYDAGIRLQLVPGGPATSDPPPAVDN